VSLSCSPRPGIARAFRRGPALVRPARPETGVDQPPRGHRRGGRRRRRRRGEAPGGPRGRRPARNPTPRPRTRRVPGRAERRGGGRAGPRGGRRAAGGECWLGVDAAATAASACVATPRRQTCRVCGSPSSTSMSVDVRGRPRASSRGCAESGRPAGGGDEVADMGSRGEGEQALARAAGANRPGKRAGVGAARRQRAPLRAHGRHRRGARAARLPGAGARPA